MPAKTEKQRRFMGAELARARAGVKTRTGMSEDKLSEYASVYKAVALIDAYLFKHGQMLPCGHHAGEGDTIDKACTMQGCGSVGGGGVTPTPSSAGFGGSGNKYGGSLGDFTTPPPPGVGYSGPTVGNTGASQQAVTRNEGYGAYGGYEG